MADADLQGPASRSSTTRTSTAARKRPRGRPLVGVCVYCGQPATTTDHLRPVLHPGGLPSGFGTDPWNCVPCCVTCNSSKGTSHWLAFMNRTTGKAPLARGVDHTSHAWRIARLRAFESAGTHLSRPWAVDDHAPAIQALRRRLESVLTAFETRMLAMRRQVAVAHTAPEAGTSRRAHRPPPASRGRPGASPGQGWLRTSLRVRRLRQQRALQDHHLALALSRDATTKT
jgi:hypothetical protein